MGAGTEGRMWANPPAEPAAPPTPYAITITENVKVPMRDGVQLDAVLYVPDRPEPAGCILIADGYGWSFDDRDRRFAEQQGYAVLNVSYRGIDESEGEAGLYDHFGEDGYDIVEWMAAQPWCADGNVGAFGSSLPGIPLWQIANELPPHLRAIAPDVACANCYHFLWYPGGMLPGPGRENRGDHEYLTAIQHRDRDAWWEDQIVDPDELAKIADAGIGVMVSGGFQDYITPGNVQAFAEFHAAGGEVKLIVDQGAHMSARRSVLGPWHHETHMDLFFAHYLRGEENAWTDGTYQGDALLWIMGPDQFRWEESWPIPDARYAKLYFRANPSGTIESLKDGSLSALPPTADEEPAVYNYFPESGPYLAAMRTSGDGWPKVDQVEYESETVTWTTDPLTGPTEVTGNIVFDFSAASSAADTDFVLMVTDVAPDGTSRYVSSGFLNAPRYPDPSAPNPLTPGEIRDYQITSQPLAYVFQEGHRIRFSVAGGATPAPDQGTAQGPGKNANYANVTIFQNAEHPASVTIPIIGTAQLPTEVASAQ